MTEIVNIYRGTKKGKNTCFVIWCDTFRLTTGSVGGAQPICNLESHKRTKGPHFSKHFVVALPHIYVNIMQYIWQLFKLEVNLTSPNASTDNYLQMCFVFFLLKYVITIYTVEILYLQFWFS